MRRTLRRASTFAMDVLQIPGSHDGLLELAFGPSTPPPEPEASLLAGDEKNGLLAADDTKMTSAIDNGGVSTRLHMEPQDSLAMTRPRAASGCLVPIPVSSIATANFGMADGSRESDDDHEGLYVYCPVAGPLPHFEWQRISTGGMSWPNGQDIGLEIV